MIVEFTGLPASGKSTIAGKLLEERTICNTVVLHPLQAIYSKPWLIRNSYKTLCSLLFSLKEPADSYKILKLVIQSAQKKKFDYLRLIVNNIFFLSLQRKFKDRKEIVIFDEGFAHNLWGILAGSKIGVRFEEYLELYELPDLIILVELDLDIVRERNYLRKRINQRHSIFLSDIENRMNDLRCIYEIVVREGKTNENARALIINNEKSDNLASNVTKIVMTIQELMESSK
jgi:thymidylate kinase